MSTPDHFVADVPLDPTRDPFLIQHRFRGRPMLPVVVAIEAFCQAVQKFVGEGRRVVRVGSVETVNGLRFFTDEVHAAHVHGRVRGNVIDCELTADFSNSKGKLVQADRVFLRGTVEVASAAKRLELHAPELPREWNDVHYADEDFVIYHGPIFRCLTQMKYVPPGTWVNFRAAPLAEFAGARGTSGWLLPDQLLDACFFACGVCLWFDSGFVSIPCNLDALTVVRCPRPDEACRAFIVQLPREGQHARFNFTLVDADNRALLQVEGFRTVIVNQGVESTPSGGLSG
jgi:3-hydroxymyristoyl/3-hydroxydecanoyl-(acyl carrier protein) dehydratase